MPAGRTSPQTATFPGQTRCNSGLSRWERPRSCRIGEAAGGNDSPAGTEPAWLASANTTRQPARASVRAATAPAGPPPHTTASNGSSIAGAFASGVGLAEAPGLVGVLEPLDRRGGQRRLERG